MAAVPKELGLRMAFQGKLMEKGGLELGTGDLEPDLQRPFLVSPVDRQHPVRRHLRKRLGIIEVIAILQALSLGNISLAGGDLGGLPDHLAHGVAHGRHLADGLGQDVADTFENLLGRIQPLFDADEFLGRGHWIGQQLVAVPDPDGQRLQALVPGIGGLGPFLGLEGKIKVLQPLGVLRRANGRRKLGVELALGLDRLEYCLFAFGQFPKPMDAKLDLADHDLVQVPGPFLAIPGNERNRVTFVQQLDDTLDLNTPNLQILRDSAQVNRNRVVHRDLTLHQGDGDDERQIRRRSANPRREGGSLAKQSMRTMTPWSCNKSAQSKGSVPVCQAPGSHRCRSQLPSRTYLVTAEEETLGKMGDGAGQPAPTLLSGIASDSTRCDGFLAETSLDLTNPLAAAIGGGPNTFRPSMCRFDGPSRLAHVAAGINHPYPS